MRPKGGDGHQNGDPEQAAPGQAEDCAQKAVEETQPNGMGSAVQGFAEDEAKYHHPDDDEQEGYDLGGSGRGDDAFEKNRNVVVVPTSNEDSGDQAAKGEELENDPAHEGCNSGVDEHGYEKPVEEVHTV